jgi:hypothetical protein
MTYLVHRETAELVGCVQAIQRLLEATHRYWLGTEDKDEKIRMRR